MRRLILALFCLLPAPFAHAWNAGGHRLVASIAWTQLSAESRTFISEALAAHPDHERWTEKAKTNDPLAIFAEASTWPDDIRHDPRFYDEKRETPTPPLSGLGDTAQHRRWHYVDFDRSGKVAAGEVDRRIEQLDQLLRSTRKNEEISYSLPWLVHLVGDIHQPLHVGHHDDQGGKAFEIENPFNKRLPFSSLHVYWDDLPASPWLRGERLAKSAAQLVDSYPPPAQGKVRLWRDESHQLLDRAYPESDGSLLPLISETFHAEARDIANRRIVDAGYRLGRMLEAAIRARVSRETH